MTQCFLSDVATIDSGAGFPIAYQGKQGEAFPFLKVSDMNLAGNERVIQSWNNCVSDEVRAILRAKAFPAGALIFPKIGAAIATNKKRQLSRPSCVDNNVMAVVPNPERLNADFLYYLFLAKNLSDFASDSNPPSIRKSEVERWKVRLPSLSEQRRIVDLLSRAEGIVRLRREAENKAAELIPALFLDMFGDPATNPKGWPIKQVSELLKEPPTLGAMAKPSSDSGRWLDLRVSNIQGGRLTLEDKRWLDLADEQIARFSLRRGDLLLARAIGSLDHLGKAVVVHPNGDWTFDSHLMRLRFDETKLLPQVFKGFLESGSGREEFLKHTRRSAVQFNINGKEIRLISLPVAPLGLQRKYLARLEGIAAMQALQSSATAKAQATFDSLLAAAFNQ